MRRIILSLLIIVCSLSVVILEAAGLEEEPGRFTSESKTYASVSGKKVDALTGTLTVSELRSNPESPEIKVRYIRLKSTAKKPGTPIIYLEGGPGSSCTWQAENPHALERWLPILAQRDVILYDQRGTGVAAQRLTWINFAPLPEDLWVDANAAEEHFHAMAEQAIPAWEKEGIQLAGYTTLENARDIDELRAAMQLPKINLLGFSYGTHLGQTYLKYFGEHVERAVLVGIEGLNENFKIPTVLDDQLAKLSDLVAQDETLRKSIPSLEALYDRVAKKLSKSPVVLEVNNPLTGQKDSVRVGKFGLDFILFLDFGDASDLPVFPRLLYSIDRGDYSGLQWFINKRYSSGFGLNAMSMFTDIASGLSEERRLLIEAKAAQSRFGNLVNIPYLSLQSVLPDVDLGDDFRAPFTTDAPVLLLSGSLDSNTPVAQGQGLQKMLGNSATHLIVAIAGHEQIMTNPVAGKAILDFLNGEDVSGRQAAAPALRFIPLTGEPSEDWTHPSLQ